jgi:hypothetical protein
LSQFDLAVLAYLVGRLQKLNLLAKAGWVFANSAPEQPQSCLSWILGNGIAVKSGLLASLSQPSLKLAVMNLVDPNAVIPV